MRVTTDITGDCIWAAVWLHAQSTRHDSTRALIHRTTGHAKIECLVDIGLPILQLQKLTFTPSQTSLEDILDWLAEDDRAAAFGEALVLNLLSRKADFPIRRGTEEIPDESNLSSDLIELVDFMDFDTSDFPQIENQQDEHLLISEAALDAGLNTELLSQIDEQIYPIAADDFSAEVNDSAFLATQMMIKDRSEHNITLPEDFDAVDLESSKQALAAIAAPNAATVFHYGDQTSTHHKRWLQAALAYPLLAEKLVIDPSLRRAIEAGEPLAAALLKSTGLSRGHLKRVKKLQSPLPVERLFEFGETALGMDPVGINRIRRYSIGGDLNLDPLIELFRSYPADWVPHNESEWRAFKDIASACGLPVNSGFGVAIEDVLRASKGQWSTFQSSLARAYGMKIDDFDRRQMVLATADAFEMVDDFRNCVIFPLLLQTISESGHPLPAPSPDIFSKGRAIAFDLIIGEAKNIPSTLLSSARHWAARIPALMAAETVEDETLTEVNQAHVDGHTWPQLAANFTAKNGLVIQNLNTREQLREESERLHHCVGRLYLCSASRGDCHIFSVRNADLSQSFSTIELSPFDENTTVQAALSQLHIVQHKALSNRKPNKKALTACQEWLSALRSGDLCIDLESVQSWRQHQREKYHLEGEGSQYSRAAIEVKWKAALGRNWHCPEVGVRVWNEWKSYILRGELARIANREYLLTKPEMRNILTSLCPSSIN